MDEGVRPETGGYEDSPDYNVLGLVTVSAIVVLMSR
jgi:hypothetical protein